MILETLRTISVVKLDGSEEWLFVYDDVDKLIHILIEMGNDEECNLNWTEIDDIIDKAIETQQKFS